MGAGHVITGLCKSGKHLTTELFLLILASVPRYFTVYDLPRAPACQLMGALDSPSCTQFTCIYMHTFVYSVNIVSYSHIKLIQPSLKVSLFYLEKSLSAPVSHSQK